MSLEFVPLGPVDSKSALDQVLACCQADNKPVPEPMMTKVFDAT